MIVNVLKRETGWIKVTRYIYRMIYFFFFFIKFILYIDNNTSYIRKQKVSWSKLEWKVLWNNPRDTMWVCRAIIYGVVYIYNIACLCVSIYVACTCLYVFPCVCAVYMCACLRVLRYSCVFSLVFSLSSSHSHSFALSFLASYLTPALSRSFRALSAYIPAHTFFPPAFLTFPILPSNIPRALSSLR